MKKKKLLYISPADMDDLTQYWDFYECQEDEAPDRLDDDSESNRQALMGI
jgi:hypothetical protein